jgi:hypothetical protein
LQQTTEEEGAVGPTSQAAEEARNRLGRLKLNAVREELRRAELSFVAAKRSLDDVRAREVAGRIADALGRARVAVDNVEQGAAVHPAVEVLVGVSRFDPAVRAGDFVLLAGRSVMLAGRILAACPYDSIAYWGRTLTALAGVLLAVSRTRAAV